MGVIYKDMSGSRFCSCLLFSYPSQPTAERIRLRSKKAAALEAPITLSLYVSHIDAAAGESGTEFTIPQGDARIFLREKE